MGALIKFELEKIIKRKVVWIPLVMMLVLAVLLTSNYFSAQVITPDGESLTGWKAMEYIEKTEERYAGPLTTEKLKEILEKEAPKMTGPDGDYASFYGDPLWQFLNENFQEDYGIYTGMTVEQAYGSRGLTLQVGLFHNWDTLLQCLSSFMLFFGLVIVIAVAGVFSNEYGNGMDALILTSKYGKTKCAAAKVIAGFSFALASCWVIYLIHICVFYVVYGMEGFQTSAQFLLNIPYSITCGQVFLWELVIWTLAMLITAAAVMLLSAVTTSSFVSLLLGMVFYLGPVVLMMMGLPVRIHALAPMMATMTDVLCISPFTFAGGQVLYQWVYVLEFGIFGIAAFVLCRKLFAAHQVK